MAKDRQPLIRKEGSKNVRPRSIATDSGTIADPRTVSTAPSERLDGSGKRQVGESIDAVSKKRGDLNALLTSIRYYS
jgi:hypothetical protein